MSRVSLSLGANERSSRLLCGCYLQRGPHNKLLVEFEQCGVHAAAQALLAAAKNALTRLDRKDAEKREAGAPAAHEGVPGSVSDQLRLAIAIAERR